MGSYEEPMDQELQTRTAYPKSQSRPWRETPLVESEPLSKAAGCFKKEAGLTQQQNNSRIFLKLENLQPGGSFKSRLVQQTSAFQTAHKR
ncbi:uncharacterized protein PADG_11705 [Paracoccidioides brasiliensis Pb18]|uniref:Tryptophan synthase beta chain-like PALP domain-containing protein n=1 Tax=Paracoccidioides brasiliensis (strain Pb18) TaxID=502780 RepID=A0A0A0HU75_PARBD|nr:uncharacterized protein PADG_11705 [Paracoccidioides brasiliensis Pb18]KGM92167.1 hypothetical protein PADG_11705 [Paracoccidioides brasiliensis Pb18]